MDELFKTMQISASGLKVQGHRLRVISQNIANVDSLPQEPGGKPYRRQTITFENELDRATGTKIVKVKEIGEDPSDFKKAYRPGHPAADKDGYVLVPNVNSMIEMMDMREAQRSYEANLSVIKNTKSMLRSTLDILQ